MTRQIVRFEPFPGLGAIRRELFDDGFFRALRGANLPATDIYTEGENTLIVEVHLPDFEEKDITVNVAGGQLTIQAERHEKTGEDQRKYVVRESSNSFYRNMVLPEQAQEDGITATFDNGLLKVSVPLEHRTEARKIEISAP